MSGFEQPADTISSGALSAENAAELFRPIRKDVEKAPVDTSEDEEQQSDEPETGEDTPAEEESEVEGASDSEQAGDEETSEDETDEEPVEDEEEPEEKGRYAVKVDGKEHKVTLDELKKGYSFTAHNTRRAQELSTKEVALREQEGTVAAEAKAYADHLAEVKEALAALTPKRPDWDKLQKENPAEFAKQWAAWDKHDKGIAKLEEEHKLALEKVTAEEQKQLAVHLHLENQKLEAAIPAWKDQKVRTKELAGMTEYAKSRGFSEDELNSVVDHRTVLLLRDAYKHSAAAKARPAAERRVEEVRSLTPGSASSTPGKATVAAKAFERLEKTGSVEDAVAAMQAQRVANKPRRR